jgi:1-acyl-sn-glycerol-3-phosphate acyltransferase
MLRSVIFTSLLFATAVPYSVGVLLVRPFNYPLSYRIARAWGQLIMALAEAICGLRYQVEGAEHLPRENAIVLMKHSSAYETIAQLVIFPRQCWVLKRELIWTPFFGWALGALHPIAINRKAGNSAVGQVLEQGAKRLRDGHWVMIFPEGTRMPPGQTRRYGISGTLLAQRTGKLLVPVAHDAGDFWPRRGLRKRPGVVRFCIGPPVNPAGREPREVNGEIQAWIEAKVAELRSGT